MKFLKHLVHRIEYFIAAIVILIALLVSVAKLLTPLFNEHLGDFEQLAQTVLQRRVTIAHIQLGWHRFSPEILLQHVTVYDEKDPSLSMGISRIDIDIGVLSSLLNWQIRPRNITLSGMHIEVHQSDYGRFDLKKLNQLNLHDNLTGSSVAADAVLGWVFMQPRLSLREIDIKWIALDHAVEQLVLSELTLLNSGQKHTLEGEIQLVQEIPTKVDTKLTWTGDINHLDDATGKLYLYVQSLALSQWFSPFEWAGFHLEKGLASVKIWGQVNKGELQAAQTIFQVYGLSFVSQATRQNEVINHASGHLGWKKQGELQTFAGDQLSLEFPDHHWQDTDFSVTVKTNGTDKPELKNLTMGYLHLVDAKRIVLQSNLLSNDQREMLVHLNPVGDLQFLQAIFPAPNEMPHFSAQFNDVKLEAWKNYPATSHLSGKLTWDGGRGLFTLNGSPFEIYLPTVFIAPLSWDKLAGKIQFQQNAASDWLIQATELDGENADISIKANVSLTVAKLYSSLIDLTADFKVKKASEIARYLPLKTFDVGFANWLQLAFTKGSADEGHAEAKGQLKNFPFTPQTGKFFVTTHVHDVDLLFAKGWPALRKIEGDLTFAGHSMKIEVKSAKLLTTKIGAMSGEISHIGGDQPAILTVQGKIQTNLSDVLDFIHITPLEDIFGKKLSFLALQGDMPLQLMLTIPLTHPEKIVVSGDTVLSNAQCHFSKWNLVFDHIQGPFHFTEAGIFSTGLKGLLLGKPAVLTFDSHDSKIQGLLASQTDIPTLESWLQVSLAPYAQGSFEYAADLQLSSQASFPNTLTLTSNLQGLSIKLPEGFGKTADEKRNVAYQINLDSAPYLKTYLTYGDLLNASLIFQQQKTQRVFWGGDIHFGKGAASLSTEKGLLVSGHLPVLNTDAWFDYFAKLASSQHVNSSTKNLLRAIDLSTDTWNVLQQQLHNVYLQAKEAAPNWNVHLQSTEVRGDITFQEDYQRHPITANFQQVTLSDALASSVKHTLNPQSLPSLSIKVDELNLNNKSIGRLVLETEPRVNGLHIKTLRIDDNAWHFTAEGEWIQARKSTSTRLQGNVVVSRLNDMLNQLDMNSSNLVGSTAQMTFDLNWNAAPYDFAIGKVSGRASINLGKGRIVELSESSNAKIGLGRLLSVFSLQTLPRRLRFDFSDLTQQGYSFDFIKGTFDLRSGTANTNDLRMDGPIARVDMSGRIGLAAKDLNMKLNVSPYMTSSLPVVATIAGGPVAGAAVWLMDKAVSNVVSKASIYQYNVTGSWANPVWTQLQTRNAAQQNNTTAH